MRTSTNPNWQNVGFAPQSNATILQTFLIYGLMSNQRYRFRLRTKNSNQMLSVPSKGSNWFETPKIVPQETVKEIQYKIFDNLHFLLEWSPIETTYSTAPNLRYNVSWTAFLVILKNKNTKNLILNNNYTNFEAVEDPTLMISIPPLIELNNYYNSSVNTSNNNFCYEMEISIRPFNDVGPAEKTTNSKIYVTKNGPKRYADKIHLTGINSTHLYLSWDWLNSGGCENVIGTQIICDEMRQIPVSKNSLNQTAQLSSRNIYDVIVEEAIHQSVPAHYTHWSVYGLKPASFYRCRLTAFDQYGKFGLSSSSTITSTNFPAPTISPEIISVRLKETDYGGFAVLLDWKSVNFSINGESEIQTLIGEKEKRHLIEKFNAESGYKIFVYDSKTAEHPSVLKIYNYDLADPTNPSARIDGLKTMFYYSIKIAGFNPGGMGPLSKEMPIRIGEKHMNEKYLTSNALIKTKFNLILFCCFFIIFNNKQSFISR